MAIGSEHRLCEGSDVVDASKRAISTYPLDVASVGLASLLIVVPLLVSPTAAAAAAASASLVWALNLTLNFPTSWRRTRSSTARAR
jgi:hypothetical protein